MSQDEETLPRFGMSVEGVRLQGVAGVLAVLGVTLAWVVGWYWETAADMAGIWWRSDTFAHGIVVLPICAWLVWRKRGAIGRLSPTPTPMLLPAIAVAGFSWLVGALVSASALMHLSLAVMLVASFIAVIGWRLARILAFPLLFLFFAVPIGEFLLPMMMQYTAEFTVHALRATGIPVYRENLFFIVPNGRWSVVEACSGLRYLVASLMVGALYAYLNYVSLRRRLLFMLVALVVPIVANWIRAYITVMVGYLFGHEFVEGFIHIVYGWVFFGIVIFLMFWIGSRWRENALPKPQTPTPVREGSRGRWLGLIPAAAAVAFFPLVYAHLQRPVTGFSVALEAPAARPGWERLQDAAPAYRPAFTGHRGEMLQPYRAADGAVAQLYIAYYAEQRNGEEMVMTGNNLDGHEGEGWRRLRSDSDQFPVGPVRQAVLKRGDDYVRTWSWYRIDGRVLSNPYLAQGLLAMAHLAGRRDDAAVIVVSVAGGESGDGGRETAEAFVREYMTAIDAMLVDAGARR